MTAQAQLEWTQGLRFVARADESPAIVMDTREGGGPTPMDLVLMGVAGCAAMDVISILQKKRAPFTGLRVDANGRRADKHPRKYTAIHLEFRVAGSGVKPGDVEKAIALSVTRYCSAIASVNAEVSHSYVIEDPGQAAP